MLLCRLKSCWKPHVRAPGSRCSVTLFAAIMLVMTTVAAAQNTRSTSEMPFEIGPFDSSSLDARAPRLFFTAAEISRAKGRIKSEAAARTILDRVTRQANEALDMEIKPLDESWWPADKAKPWEETYPQVYQHTGLEPAKYARAADTLATAWLLTGNDRYADKSRDLLMNLASYSFAPEHFDVGMNYSGWGMLVLKVYDALLPRLTADQRKQVDACMTRLARAVAGNDVYWVKNNIGGGINNHLAWHRTMLGLLGMFYGRQEMVDYCMHGHRGLNSLLEDGLLDDGLWCEGSLFYQFAAIDPMIFFADCQRRMGNRPALSEITAANGRTLKQSFDAMFNVLAADGLIPPIGDAYGYRQKLWKIPFYEYGWALWGDPKYAWLLNHNPEPSVYLLFAPPLPANTPAPPIGSLLRPEHGYAFLRSHRDAEYWDSDAWCAMLTYDRAGVHSNADKLSLMLFGQKQLLLSDVEGRATVPHAFSSRIQRELNRGALSQNTVMIDGADQRYSDRMLRLVEFRDLPDEKRVTAADDQGLLYEGVRQMRTVAMTPDYVLDVFQVIAGGKPRQIDWIAHVMDEKARPLPETGSLIGKAERFELPKTGAWVWLREARSFKPEGPIQLGWTRDNAALRLLLLNPDADRLIYCGYPATDEPSAGSVPMIMLRKTGTQVVFAALWLIGDRPGVAELKALPPYEGKLVYEVIADGKARRHLLPQLTPAP